MSVTAPAPVVGWRPAVASFGWRQRAAGCPAGQRAAISGGTLLD